MRKLSLWAGLLAAATAAACAHAPVETAPTPSIAETPAGPSATGYYVSGLPVAPAPSVPAGAAVPGYYILGLPVTPPPSP